MLYHTAVFIMMIITNGLLLLLVDFFRMLPKFLFKFFFFKFF